MLCIICNVLSTAQRHNKGRTIAIPNIGFNEHHFPCRQFRAKSTLYNSGLIRNWKIIKRRKSKMWTDKLQNNIYLVYNEV